MTVHRRLALGRKLRASRKMAAIQHAVGKCKVSEAALHSDCLAARRRGGFAKESLDHLHAAERKLVLFLSEFPASNDYPGIGGQVGAVRDVVQPNQTSSLLRGQG